MITNKQFGEFIKFIQKLQFEGNDVYINGKKIVTTDFNELKIWTKSSTAKEYVTYSFKSYDNFTKLDQLYSSLQTLKNDYSYMQAKLALGKYNSAIESKDTSSN